MKTVLKDENWTSGADGTVETYTDNEGRTVLERRIHTDTKGTEHLDTYYVYDDLNRLRYVLPPQAEEIFRQAGETRSGSDKGIADYAYVYRYDGNGNCISKKMPGSEEVEMVYDKARRRVLSRDGKCRKEGKWMFWLYEETGRQAVQGICTNPDVEALKNDTVTTRWTDRGILAGYEAPGTLGQDIQLLKADYYDYYAFLDDEELLPENRQEYGKVYPDTQKPDAAGLKTGTASYAADGSGTLTGMEVLYYDSFGRCVQKRLKNHLGETDEEYTAYTFTGLPRLVMRVHRSPDQEERKEMLRYEYDTMDRLLKVYFRLDDKEEELVCDNVYDDLGRVVVDRRNGTDNLRTGYTYNIRNWMTSIESPLFKEELHYTDGTGTPCYNGNISSISWKAGEEQTTRGYRFTYDGLDRMKTAEYGEGERLASNPNRFNEEVTAYDKTGNILGIRRMGQTGAQEYGLVDNLALTYSGNQLTKVTDNAASSAYNNGFEFKDGADRETEYTYDENGNLTQDLNRNIKDIQYNFLNLPQRIEFEDGSTTEYLYDAEGRKLRTLHKADGKTTTTDYAGNLIYENGNPARLLTGYGYVSLLDGMYHYYLQDHLENNRVVADRNGKVEEVNHYYPFGGMFAHNGNVQPYKYNGKELDTRNGLNWYDYGARHYDATLGRWHVQDPMQEKYSYVNSYCYVCNNPIKFIDVEGLKPRMYIETQGLGHTFITTGNGDNTTVYTYGRYGAVYKDKSSANSTSPIGEGVLIIYKGTEAKEFIKDQINNRKASAFEFANGSDSKVDRFFQDKFNQSDKIPSGNKIKNKSNARVIDEYNLLNNNCTTLSIEAIEKGGGDVSFLKGEIAPFKALQGASKAIIWDNIRALFGNERKIISLSPEKILNEFKTE